MEDLFATILFFTFIVVVLFGAIVLGILLIIRQKRKGRHYPTWLQVAMYWLLLPVLLQPLVSLMSLFVAMNRPADYANMPDLQREDDLLRTAMNSYGLVLVGFVWLLLRAYRTWGAKVAATMLGAFVAAIAGGLCWMILC